MLHVHILTLSTFSYASNCLYHQTHKIPLPYSQNYHTLHSFIHFLTIVIHSHRTIYLYFVHFTCTTFTRHYFTHRFTFTLHSHLIPYSFDYLPTIINHTTLRHLSFHFHPSLFAHHAISLLSSHLLTTLGLLLHYNLMYFTIYSHSSYTCFHPRITFKLVFIHWSIKVL